jgi:hypothetical protein
LVKKIVKDKNNCLFCYGFGIWKIGTPSPVGPIDFEDGVPTKKCPECGSGDPKDYWRTLEGKLIYKKNLSDAHLKNILIHLNTRKEGKTRVRKMIEREIKRRGL